jgi:hypothetical protein
MTWSNTHPFELLLVNEMQTTEGLTCERPFSVQATMTVSRQGSRGSNSATNLARKSDNLALFQYEERPLKRVVRVALLCYEFSH